MKKYRMYKYILFAVVTLMCVGCKAPSLTLEEQVDLPNVIAGETADTLSLASVSWKEFFPDTYLVSYIDTALARNYTFLQLWNRCLSLASSYVSAGEHCCPKSL